MDYEAIAAHILKYYDQAKEPEEMRGAIVHYLKQAAKPIGELKEILTDPVNQLEVTKGGYYIYRFDLETMHRIADAIGIDEADNAPFATYTLSELPRLIKP